VPYGLQAELCGGSLIDKELLEIVITRAKAQGIKWKDDPIARAEHSTVPILLHIEDAKIKLSNAIGSKAKLSGNYSETKTTVKLEKGSLHPEAEVNVELTGEDLKTVIRKIWRRQWGEIITRTVTEARNKLDTDHLDKVLVAGGSSRLPFMKEEIQLPLRSLVPPHQIYFGTDVGNSVAFGIACECNEQVRRYPNLSVGKVASCLLNDLYIGFRKTRRDPIMPPKKLKLPDGSFSRIGQLLSSPFETDELILEYKVELPFDPESRIFYAFSEEPFSDDDDQSILNINNDVVSVKSGRKYNKKCDLHLEFKKSGNVKPVFYFSPHGKNAEPDKVECAEFYIDNLKVKDGQEFLGIDFGTSNSYVVRFLCANDEIQASDYPEYKVNKVVMDKLRILEAEIIKFRDEGLLTKDELKQHAKDKILVNVFHSNKIEGNALTKGETELFIIDQEKEAVTRNEQEAKNLIEAYNWVIDNVDYLYQDPEGFVRNINKMILDGIADEAGKYRKTAVTISGMNFVPPPAAAVPPLMQSFGEELKKGLDGRSALEYSVAMHTKLVSILPFIDANGRTGRLLMNAILMANDLPVTVINYDDKQRYLDALSHSNEGDISPLVDFLIECFQQQLEEIKFVSVDEKIEDEPLSTIQDQNGKDDPIKDALIEIGLPISEDPLSLIMEEKIKKLSSIKEAEYESWKQAFATLIYEARTIVEEFNGNMLYRNHGFQMQIIDYDMLSYEKYCDIIKDQRVSKTWFFAVQIIGPISRTKILFFFEHIQDGKDAKIKSHKIILTLVRFDGSSYHRMMSEPITLRTIAFKDGQLVFIDASGNQITDSTAKVLKKLFAELIKAYVKVI
jgi:Fic family protein